MGKISKVEFIMRKYQAADILRKILVNALELNSEITSVIKNTQNQSNLKSEHLQPS
jgi:hypothetical protein